MSEAARRWGVSRTPARKDPAGSTRYAIRVKGRINPVRIYDPLAEAGQQIPDQSTRAAIYAEGLARWRARDFAGAAYHFERIAAADRPFALFAARAIELDVHPPAADWEPITTLEGK